MPLYIVEELEVEQEHSFQTCLHCRGTGIEFIWETEEEPCPECFGKGVVDLRG